MSDYDLDVDNLIQRLLEGRTERLPLLQKSSLIHFKKKKMLIKPIHTHAALQSLSSVSFDFSNKLIYVSVFANRCPPTRMLSHRKKKRVTQCFPQTKLSRNHRHLKFISFIVQAVIVPMCHLGYNPRATNLVQRCWIFIPWKRSDIGSSCFWWHLCRGGRLLLEWVDEMKMVRSNFQHVFFLVFWIQTLDYFCIDNFAHIVLFCILFSFFSTSLSHKIKTLLLFQTYKKQCRHLG